LVASRTRAGLGSAASKESQIEKGARPAVRGGGRPTDLAFQVVENDLPFDVQGSPDQMGKRTQKDQESGQATYPFDFRNRTNRWNWRPNGNAGVIRATLGEFEASAEPLQGYRRHQFIMVGERKAL